MVRVLWLVVAAFDPIVDALGALGGDLLAAASVVALAAILVRDQAS